MAELEVANNITPFTAILWIFYPMTLLVGVELLLRALRDDDDDDEGGKGIRVARMQPAYAPSGT